ncbi:MAG: hypothetical protein EU539_00275 [Promethearchaeota archaeon]|nr:MAG: hypothetical protein EU539_00275 [Candidatus Lokiarchaeota archaeon]
MEDYIKALHCDVRWIIIDILKDGPKTSNEIFKALEKYEEDIKNKTPKNCKHLCLKGKGRDIQKPTLYYHLRELESVGIIEVAKTKPSKKKKAPIKVWKLNIEKLTINFTK